MSKKNPWISTKDAVPDNRRRVLVIWNDLETIGRYDSKFGGLWSISGLNIRKFEVKFWRDLPKPPEGIYVYKW